MALWNDILYNIENYDNDVDDNDMIIMIMI